MDFYFFENFGKKVADIYVYKKSAKKSDEITTENFDVFFVKIHPNFRISMSPKITSKMLIIIKKAFIYQAVRIINQRTTTVSGPLV